VTKTEPTDTAERLRCAECCSRARSLGGYNPLYECQNPGSDHHGHVLTDRHKCCPQREPRAR
jgi:hypothetical protein